MQTLWSVLEMNDHEILVSTCFRGAKSKENSISFSGASLGESTSLVYRVSGKYTKSNS